ncbi:MerR family mercuric resistance operon transcriptional regulator [Marinimicrobium koreense]|uniref:Mercuric resistance operon regulatory protein n=1 Tax=Marinimicrobium koreense TaxID=306545 RepID=A0A3N1P1E3_9GAMM|nr:MerR family DNA-binding protein [Marinimicrobium koreense]ROQ21418.1 MerR family mercuric resistance operon transcriptional regulator [Marinimicrobium koreense]
MTIGTLAKAAGVNVETIRYYQRCDLMPEPEKPYGGIRQYDERALSRLHFIRSAQWLGFSLKEVGELLRLDDGTHCDEARGLGESKLLEVRAKIRGLRQIEKVLDGMVRSCLSQSNITCPMIASLYRD